MVEIKWYRLNKAYCKWIELAGFDASLESVHKFYDYIGHLDYGQRSRLEPIFKPEALRIIEWLNGPHAEALYKVRKLQLEQQNRDQGTEEGNNQVEGA